jgi:hypothetical protein
LRIESVVGKTELISVPCWGELQALLFPAIRIGLSLDDVTGAPVFECKKCNLKFSERNHVSCSECVGNAAKLLERNVWADLVLNKKYVSKIQESLKRNNTEGDVCVCVSCLEVIECSIFRRRRTATWLGWGYLLSWKNKVMDMVPRDLEKLSRYMWTNEIREQAQYGLCGEGKGEGSASGVSKKKARKKKNHDEDNRGVDEDGDEVEVDKICDDITRAVLNLNVTENIESSETEITRKIEEILKKNDGDLFSLSQPIAHLYKSCIQVKEVLQSYLRLFEHDQHLNLKGVTAELEKNSDLKKELDKNRPVWSSKIREWTIEFNTQLDSEIEEQEAISPNKVMMAYYKQQEWFQCTVVRRVDRRNDELSGMWEVAWHDKDRRDLKKFRWQLRNLTASEASEADVARKVRTTAVVQGEDEGQPAASTASDAAQQVEGPEQGGEGEGGEGEAATTGFLCVRLSAFQTARNMIQTKTTARDVDNLTNFSWDVHTATQDVFGDTLKALRQKFGDGQDTVISDLQLQCELLDTVERWICEGFKVFFTGLVKKSSESEMRTMKTGPEDWKSLYRTVKECLSKKIESDIVKRHDVLIQAVVKKHWEMNNILENDIQGCSQDLMTIHECQSGSRMRMRSRMSQADTRCSRFSKETELMNRVLGTPSQYLVHLSREQLRAMSCCNDRGLHEFLIKKHKKEQLSQGQPENDPWFCSQCKIEHDAILAICPQNFHIKSPKLQRFEKKTISCPLAVQPRTVREFYDNTDEGRKIIRALKIDNYEVDHIIPVKSGGAHHVCNYWLMSREANKWFGSDGSKQEDKLKLVGGVAKLCAVSFKTHQTTFWNVSGFHRHPRVDVADFRVLESKSDLELDPGLTFSPYVFVLLPTESWLKNQLCHGNVETVRGHLVYVQGSEVESVNQTTYHTRGGNGNTFVKTQHVRDLVTEPGQELEIEVRPLTFELWSAKETRGSSYVGIDEHHFPKGQTFVFVCL